MGILRADPVRWWHPLALAGVALLLPATSRAQTESPALEYQVKAAYLLNFTRYVEWPVHSLPTPQSAINVCVMGKDPFGPTLDQVMNGRTSQGHPIVVRRVTTAQSAEGCHLVFLTDDSWGQRRSLVAGLTARGILTVGDSDQFARSGGVIGFLITQETVRFVVNLNAIERAGIRISSRMLSLASTLYSSEGPRF